MTKIKSIFIALSMCAIVCVTGCGQSNVNEVTDTSVVEESNTNKTTNKNNTESNVVDDVTDTGRDAVNDVGEAG